MATLTTLPATANTDDILSVIKKDGAVILKDMITSAEVDQVLTETLPYIEATRNGQDEFVGLQTTRTGALVARSPACRDLIANPSILTAAKTFLAPYCSRIQLHVGQIIRLRPGQPKQGIHPLIMFNHGAKTRHSSRPLGVGDVSEGYRTAIQYNMGDYRFYVRKWRDSGRSWKHRLARRPDGRKG